MIVIDASVANKLVLPNEEGYQLVITILENHAKGIEEILVPDFLFYEVANTLATKAAVPAAKIPKALSRIYNFDLNIYHPNEQDVINTARLAKKHRTSVYDMLYAEVAKNHKARLITADEKFIKQTGFKWVKLLKDS